MSRVYQVQHNPNIDTSDALRYGELYVVIERGGEPAVAPHVLRYELRYKMRDFGPDDYLLPTGSPACIAAAACIAARRANGQLNMLLWDKRRARYQAQTIDLDGV